MIQAQLRGSKHLPTSAILPCYTYKPQTSSLLHTTNLHGTLITLAGIIKVSPKKTKKNYSSEHNCPVSEEISITFLWSWVGWVANENTSFLIFVSYSLIAVMNGMEDEDVAVDDDDERYEEDKDKEHHRVCPNWGDKGHVIPRARRHQTFRDIGTWRQR